MKNLIVVLLVAACLVLGCPRQGRGQSKGGKPRAASATPPRQKRQKAPAPVEIYTGLRGQFLSLKPEDAGAEEPTPGARAYGILMEMGFDSGLASIVSLSTGDASLYTGTGGGIIGGGSFDGVKRAARAFVSEAGRHLPRLSPTKEFPHPEVGRIRFYVLTREGVYTAEAGDDELLDERHRLHALFLAGNEVITQLRLNSEKKKE